MQRDIFSRYTGQLFQKFLILRQYRTKTVRKMRSQIFCQMKQKTQLILCVSARLFVKYDGKAASRLRAEPLGVICAVLP